MQLTYRGNDAESNLFSLIRDRGLNDEIFPVFRKIIYTYYKRNAREFPWRINPTPYRVFVSEIMLQQTQADRVAEKFGAFVETFPDFNALAAAPFSEVLALWHGLGYNRRALALVKGAAAITAEFDGVLPSRREDLMALPGIGPATASSILAYAFNLPEVFIETNIRTVFIHFFFPGREKVTDDEILPLAGRALDRRNPRRWYNALMDYGVMLKKTRPNPGRRSAAYKKQSPFKNSHRRIRGAVLKEFVERPVLGPDEVSRAVGIDRKAATDVLDELRAEGFIVREGRKYRLS